MKQRLELGDQQSAPALSLLADDGFDVQDLLPVESVIPESSRPVQRARICAGNSGPPKHGNSGQRAQPDRPPVLLAVAVLFL